MKIVILNGNIASSTFDSHLDELRNQLEISGHDVMQIALRNLGLKYCTGCFDCWTKTPGMCDRDQASHEMDRAVINSDFSLWATPLKMGFPTALMKTAFDKHLPLIHPYMVVDQGEAHHLTRYKKYPRIGMLVERENDTSDQDLDIIKEIFARTALNFKSKLEFLETTDLPAKDLAQKILRPAAGPHLYKKNPSPIPGVRIPPPQTITIFNGSPRGKKGNTPIMLGEFQKGFNIDGEIHHLVMAKDIGDHVQAFRDADCVWLGFPLYTDGMPGLVKNFIEALEPLKDRENNPPIGFLVQSGFPEGIHSRYVERYLFALSRKLRAPYLGTIIKGNGEGTRLRPREHLEGLFDQLQSLGRNLREQGELDQEILNELAKPVRFPRILGPVYRLFLRTKMSHAYFDNLLSANDAYERRNDQPFLNR
jgi:multimeric flavodoxin WrbA